MGCAIRVGRQSRRRLRAVIPAHFDFPRGLTNYAIQAEHRFNFSFSGLKTAVLRQVRELGDAPLPVADLAASFQAAVVDVLVSKTAYAAGPWA